MDLLETAEPEFVKLARSLTMNAARRSAQAAIKSALKFARAHDSIVIAEGVENELVSDRIRSLDIPLGQGFGLGRPTVAADLLDSAPAAQEREDANGVERLRLPGRAHRKEDAKERLHVQRADDATSGRAS